MTPRIEDMPATAAEALAPLHRACFADDPWDAAALAAILALPGAFGRIAWVDDAGEAEPAGFVLACDLGGECEILSLGVVPDHRHHGIGRALLRAALAEAGRRGSASVVLEVAVDNDAACALYRGTGFAAVGRRCRYYRRDGGDDADALILRHRLAAPVAAR